MAQACKSESFIHPFVCRTNQRRDIAPLMRYYFKFNYIPGKDNPTDWGSRNPNDPPNETNSGSFKRLTDHAVAKDMPNAINLRQIQGETERDPELRWFLKVPSPHQNQHKICQRLYRLPKVVLINGC